VVPQYLSSVCRNIPTMIPVVILLLLSLLLHNNNLTKNKRRYKKIQIQLIFIDIFNYRQQIIIKANFIRKKNKKI